MAKYELPKKTRILNAAPPAPTRNTQTPSTTPSLDLFSSFIDDMKFAYQRAEVKSEELLAEVLYARTLTIDDFISIYTATVTSFSHSVLKGLESGGISDFFLADWKILEVYVSIPRLTGMLPYPDKEKLATAISSLSAPISSSDAPISNASTAAADRRPFTANTHRFVAIAKKDSVLEDGKEQLEKIAMYPRAYKVIQNESPPTMGQICKVKIPDGIGYFPSRFAMEYLGVSTAAANIVAKESP